MRKPGFGQRPFGGRSGRGGSGEGRPFEGKRPGGGSSGQGRRGEGRGEGRAEGDRKPRSPGEGQHKFKPRDGKRPFKQDGERGGRSGAEGRGGFGKGPRPFKQDGERGERGGSEGRSDFRKSSRPFKPGGERGERSGAEARGGFGKGPRPFRQDGERSERSGAEGRGEFRKGPRPFRQDGERGERSGAEGRGEFRKGPRPFRQDGERGERSGAEGRGEFRKGPRPFRQDGERGERGGSEGRSGFRKGPRPFKHGEDRGEYSSRPPRREGLEKRTFRKDGAPSGEDRPQRGGEGRFERKGPPRDRFAGEGERRREGPKREGWTPREDRGPRDRDEGRGEGGFKPRTFDKGKRHFEAKGDRPRGREDRPREGARERYPSERPPVGRLLPDRDEQAERSARGQGKFKPRERDTKSAGPAVTEPMRIAKAMARAGLCSRREAERWIADGRVSVNGEVLDTAAYDVKPKDRVLIDGKPLPVAEPPQLWRYYKPKGLVTTHHDPEGRPTVFENLPPELPRVVSVGRLDFNTEGLILLTNHGELARHLELPATGWLRRYRVRAKGRVDQETLNGLKNGVDVDGVHYGPVEATLDSEQGANVWLSVGIREGKNREVRKVLGTLGLEVNRLIRISFGPFQLLDLKPGEVERVRRRVLFDQLGPQLAAELGVEMPEPVAAKPQKQKPQKPKPEARGEEPEWQLLEDTDLDLKELESDEADSEDAADEAEGKDAGPEGKDE